MALYKKSPIRVLMVHNAYQQRGGEDSVVDTEIELLKRYGHEVELFSRHNDEVAQMGAAAVALQALWSTKTSQDLAFRIQAFKPDVIHAHNTFPLISPSLYWTAHSHKIPVIQTLHNFRLLCPQGMFLREEKVCEDCLGKVPWRGVMHKCYRNSYAQSGVLASMVMFHKGIGSYHHKVSHYIALSEFSRNKFLEGGLPSDRISVKPNYVDVAAPDKEGVRQKGLFVGRLSTEKGINVLLKAVEQIPNYRAEVAGTGPEEPLVKASSYVNGLGFLTQEAALAKMQSASYLLLPSICYENFPRTLVEAFACELPVIASRMGAMAELIEDGKTGLLFEPGNANDLAHKIKWAEAYPDAMLEMGRNARIEYEKKYTPAHNYAQLIKIYENVIDRS